MPFIDVFDIERQNDLAKHLVTKLGNSEARGLYAFISEKSLQLYRQQTKGEILGEIVNGKSLITFIDPETEQRCPGDLANGGLNEEAIKTRW